MAKITKLDDRAVIELNRLFKKVDTISGDGVYNSSERIVIRRAGSTGGRRHGGGAVKLPTAQYQGMYWGMTTGNALGFDFIRAIPQML
jgi:hypothetical protein